MVKSKRKSLEVNDRVFLQEVPYCSEPGKPREFQIVKANKTSAYAILPKDYEKYNKGMSIFTVRINQGNRIAKSAVAVYRYWDSMEQYEKYIAYKTERKKILQEVQTIINNSSNEELKKLIEGCAVNGKAKRKQAKTN